MPSLEDIAATFQSVDEQVRLEVLLDYSKKLPDLPPELAEAADADDALVPECMTPVWMWILPDGDVARLHIRVAEEAPTVKGILSIIVHAYDGESPEKLATIPQNLIGELGLSRLVRMNRAVGINAILGRIRRRATQLAEQASEHGSAT